LRKKKEKHYVVCIENKGYSASLIIRRIYERIADTDASNQGLIRVIDESGEDYLYPDDYFSAIELPKSVEKAFSVAN
jgi:hypothetical protein